MCGIAGVLAFAPGTRTDLTLIKGMCDAMRHRGPDGEGQWVSSDGAIGFGHRRLAIVDLSPAGAQPMADPEEQVWITYNGEIYNHVEIRTELEQLGCVFRSHCDTEVIIQGYKVWGLDCLKRFRGMFAFGLWDAKLQRLWLVRDRMGVKPLYYTIANGRLLFASEIKALLADTRIPRAINEDALFHYLSFLTTPAPTTLFKGISKLPNGSMLVVEKDGSITETRWWDALQERRDVGNDEASIAQTLLAELQDAVRIRKVADVEVGVFLSGGIDSSVNAALFSERGIEPVKTFSIGYDRDYGTYHNELDYARQVAESLSASHHELRLTKTDFLDILPRLIALQDEPIADPVCFPLYCVSRFARLNGVTVCQVGEGADELFWGYPNWKRALTYQRAANAIPVPAFLKKMALGLLRGMGKANGQAFDWLYRSALGHPIFWGGAEAFTHDEKLRLLSPRLREKFRTASSWDVIGPIHRRFRAGGGKGDLDWMTYLDLNFRLPELLLMRVDKMSMGTSLEARVPFLDYRFVGFALSIPEVIKTRAGELKHILKRAVRGLIPDAIIDRKKQGFGVPMNEWLLEGLGPQVLETVDRFIKATDILDPQHVRAMTSDPRGRVHVWYLINLALWWEHYIEPATVGPTPPDPMLRAIKTVASVDPGHVAG